MTFYVGQKVVCVDTRGWREADYRSWNYPRKGDVATVSHVYEHLGALCVALSEFPNNHPTKPGFYATRFRPVVDRKTDISIFVAMLNPSSTRSVPAADKEIAHG